jgi:hypothetical protein
MSTKQLSLDDLVRGLEYFGDRYEAFDVFARDVKDVGRALTEQTSGEAWPGGRPDEREPAFAFVRGRRTYKLRFHPSGFARLTRAKNGAVGGSENPVARSLLGAALAATVLDHVLPSAIVGFLVGAALGPEPDAPRRGFVMSYDLQAREWQAYDGPLANRVREVRLEADAALRSAG